MSAMTKQKRNPVHIIWVRDVLQPVNSKTEYRYPFIGNGTLADYIPADVKVTEHTVVRQNGHYISRERWTSRGVLPGDEIYIGCVPGGIGAAIIGSAAAIGTATATVPGVLGAVAINLALSVGLSYLSAMLVDQPDAPDALDSQTYGGGRITTRSQHGASVPIVYGEHIVGGNLIASYTGHMGGRPAAYSTHTTTFGQARHNVVLGLCEGPVQSIGGIAQDTTQYFDNTGALYGPNSSISTSLEYAKTSSHPLHLAAGNQELAIRKRLPWSPVSVFYVKTVRIAMRRVGTIATGKHVTCGIQLGGPEQFGVHVPDGSYITDVLEVDPTTIPTSWKVIQFDFALPAIVDCRTTTRELWVRLNADYDYASGYVELALCNVGYADYNGVYASDGATWGYSNYEACCYIGATASMFSGTDGIIKVNGSPVESYASSGLISTRRGTLWQEALPNTSKATLELAIDQDIPKSSTHWIEFSTTNEVDGIGVVIEFPNGIYRTDSGGHREGTDVGFNIRMRVNGTSEWPGFVSINEHLYSETTNTFTIRIPFPTEKNSSLSQFRGSIVDVGVQRRSVNEQSTTWKSLQEYNDDDAQTYPYTALLQLDTDIGTSQGSLDSITTRIQGKQVHQYDANGWANYGYSTNPAWCCLDFLLNKRYGGGNRLTTANVDLDSFVAWADYCEESISDGNGGSMNRWDIGLVIDTEKAFWDWAKQIASAGRCKLIRSGDVIRAKIEKAEDPVQMFTAGNVIAGSFKLQYVNPAKRPNAVDVKFLNADLDFAEDIASAEDRSLRNAGEPDIRETVDLYGCTNMVRAKRHAKFLLNVAKYTNWLVEFETFINAIACEPGDVITISNDAINWEAVGGRLKENAPGVNSIKLDRDLVIDALGDEYIITVQSVNAGQDILQTSTVIEGPGTYAAGSIIDISPSWTTTPQAGDVYSVMPIRSDADARHGKGAKLARIVETSITDDFFVRVKAMQYDERVYFDDPGNFVVPPKTQPMDGRMIPPRVANLVARPVAMGNGVGIAVSWSKSTWPYPYECEIWLRLHGASRHFSHSTFKTSANSYTFSPVNVASTWDVVVCPCAPWTGQHRNPEVEARTTVHVTEPAWTMGWNTVTGASF